ncbi:Abi-alpha family protein [Pedosphaera parvula]|uniref:DUF4393 domain-containing protein n=1 Tax=Pedosphaera parvula (strain Ellin514) TaxID=320771 RepID=B9XKC8_PEDPL|nr:Abi-alpha family protein [Pedosphaera parvula]EEF59766.1 hypothetical protein Cflav_PD2587 [Pedosphaera parvula Ellin514]
MIPEEVKKGGFDLAGVGKVAEAIPPEVYKQTTATVLKTFEALVAPLTQTTDGLGRLIRQTFDNWVEVRKAIGTYTLEQALIRAKARAQKQGEVPQLPSHPKTFLRALEESSLETDSVVHEMWVNLLESQLVDHNSHPRFVSILSQLGPEEARLLLTLKPRPEDPRLSYFLGGSEGQVGMKERWVSAIDEQQDHPWSLSVTLLCQQSLADVIPFKPGQERRPLLLLLTRFGQEFMAAVAPQD